MLTISNPKSSLYTVARLAVYFFSIWIFLIGTLHAQSENFNTAKKAADLTELSLEELMNIKVTSVSKKEENLSDAAAAIFVITQEDIRRSGVRNIPDALRMVPGMQVAQVDANKWAISSRGFNGRFANKLLVLIDGRSVYTPLFSGVFWDAQDVMLEDVERIEVIRGPGATLWGANAVNGVINIITKSAKDTRGGFVMEGGGSLERAFGNFRYSNTSGERGNFRVYAKYFERNNLTHPLGGKAADQWDVLRGGFRYDWQASTTDFLTLQGDIVNGTLGQILTVPSLSPPYSITAPDHTDVNAGHVLGRWNHNFSDRSDLTLQSYYDYSDREEQYYREVRNTFDIDFQHRFKTSSRNEIVWGLGYRVTWDALGDFFTVSLDPNNRLTNLFSSFVQDEISLVPGRLRFTVGSKFEHNSYTGFEIQPNARFLWTPNERHSSWAAVSRSVRTPSRAESDVRVNYAAYPDTSGTTYLVAIFGNEDYKSEELTSYEFGHRLQPSERVSADANVFYNVYKNLTTVEPGTPFFENSPSPPHVVIPLVFDNKMSGETYGFELVTNLYPKRFWKLSVAYTWFRADLRFDPTSQPSGGSDVGSDSSPHQFNIRSYLDVSNKLNFDAVLYYVDRLRSQDIPGYVRVDGRIEWKATKATNVVLGGQNLFSDGHQEFGTSLGEMPSKISRSVYALLSFEF